MVVTWYVTEHFTLNSSYMEKLLYLTAVTTQFSPAYWTYKAQQNFNVQWTLYLSHAVHAVSKRKIFPASSLSMWVKL
jgi:hypothetical protein